MVKRIVTFSVLVFMTTGAYGQSFYGTNNLATAVFGAPGDTLIEFDFATANYSTVAAIGGGIAGGFTGLDWEDSTGTGSLIGCIGYSGVTTGEFYSIDPADASAALLGNAAADMSDLALNKFDDKMYSVDPTDTLYRDDNGDSIPETVVGAFPLGGINVGLGFDDNGDLYVLDIVTDSIYMLSSADVQAGNLGNLTTVVDYATMNYDANFSQGLSFSAGTGYHAAINGDTVEAQNYTFDSGGNYTLQSTFPIDISTGFPEVEVGDLTLSVVEDLVKVLADSITIFRGVLVGGVLSDTFDDDGSRMLFNPGFTLNSSEAPVWLIFDGNAGAGVSAIDVEVDSQAGTPNLTYTVELFNWGSGDYDVIGVQSESFPGDTTENFAGVPADHVDTGGEVRCRIGWRKTGLTLNFPWEIRLDRLVWNAAN